MWQASRVLICYTGLVRRPQTEVLQDGGATQLSRHASAWAWHCSWKIMGGHCLEFGWREQETHWSYLKKFFSQYIPVKKCHEWMHQIEWQTSLVCLDTISSWTSSWSRIQLKIYFTATHRSALFQQEINRTAQHVQGTLSNTRKIDNVQVPHVSHPSLSMPSTLVITCFVMLACKKHHNIADIFVRHLSTPQ